MIPKIITFQLFKDSEKVIFLFLGIMSFVYVISTTQASLLFLSFIVVQVLLSLWCFITDARLLTYEFSLHLQGMINHDQSVSPFNEFWSSSTLSSKAGYSQLKALFAANVTWCLFFKSPRNGFISSR